MGEEYHLRVEQTEFRQWGPGRLPQNFQDHLHPWLAVSSGSFGKFAACTPQEVAYCREDEGYDSAGDAEQRRPQHPLSIISTLYGTQCKLTLCDYRNGSMLGCNTSASLILLR